MKIRIKGNSIRLRLTRSEVDLLATDGYLEERTEFTDSVFKYTLQSKPGIDNLDADFRDGTIAMYVPSETCAEWAKNETIGYSNSITLPNGNTLFLLLEKDFKCIDSSMNEDQSDNFENPTHSCE